ncbi:MAG: DeoR/GlpR transcriptional regulator [Clostridia bacterium]|nr:DeoR/GlpR transcriptional regulator [Clostridia bacterium]
MNQNRRDQIEEWLTGQKTITNEEIMDRFGISIETVRRDLAYLERQGVLKRVYGGAVKRESLRSEPQYVSREKKDFAEKQKIARAAAALLETDDSVFFDLGTTVAYVAENLSREKRIYAFTNAVRTAVALSERAGEVILTGGKLRAGEYALSGSIAKDVLSRFNIRKAVIGAAGVTEDGVSDFIPEEADLRRFVIGNADTVILVADHTKFGVRAMCGVCGVSDVDILVTDEEAPKDILKCFEKNGAKVIIAK